MLRGSCQHGTTAMHDKSEDFTFQWRILPGTRVLRLKLRENFFQSNLVWIGSGADSGDFRKGWRESAIAKCLAAPLWRRSFGGKISIEGV